MEYLGEWLQHLLKTLLICGFVCLLIPNNAFKVALRLVLGLMIISIFLQMISGISPHFSQWQFAETVPTEAANSDAIFQSGIEMREKWENFFRIQMENAASRQEKSETALRAEGDENIEQEASEIYSDSFLEPNLP